MELWFKRAMTADPDCYPACLAKLDYLQLAGQGRPGTELVAFGRQCARGGHPDGWVAGDPLRGTQAGHGVRQSGLLD